MATRTWDAIQQYRNLGGNLAFLSANDFFYRIDLRGTRHLPDRPLARRRPLRRSPDRRRLRRLVRQHLRQQALRRHRARRRLRGSSTGRGSRTASSFGSYGIEINQCDTGVAAAHARARRGEEPVRPGPLGRDDLLRDAAGSEGVLSRGDQLRRVGRVAGRLTAARQPLAAGSALRETTSADERRRRDARGRPT